MNNPVPSDSARWSVTGQAMVEFLIILPSMLLLLLGAVQFALIYHAKITLNYAAFEGVRAGALHHGSFAAVKSGFARGMAPLYSYSRDDSDQVGAFKKARKKVLKEFDSKEKLIRIERLSPTEEDFVDFGLAGRDEEGNSVTEIPNDNLRYRSSRRMKKSHSTIQDANLLHLRFTYWYPLYVPLVNKLIFSFICSSSEASETPQKSRRQFDAVCKGKEPRIPLTAVAAMRMQTRPRKNSTGYQHR